MDMEFHSAFGLPTSGVVAWVMRKIFRQIARAIARFGAAQQAASAVEFALIAPAFLALLVGILQVAVFLFAQQSLQNAAMGAGRLLLTGQAQNLTQSAFKTQVCNNHLPSILFQCNSLIVIVQSSADFASANTSMPALYNNGQPITNWAYNPGTPGQVVVVQLVYPWSVVMGPLGFALANLPNGATKMMGGMAFRVEPY
jgi:Flp pilus assembly protein TadG